MPYFIIFLLIVSFAFAQERKEVSVTVYNQDFAIVKDTRSFDLKKGFNEISITDVASKIDATTVGVDFDGTILEQNYRYDLVSLNKILEKYIDKQITLQHIDGNVLKGKLLSAGSQLVLEREEGGLLMLPNYKEYTVSVDELPSNFLTRPTLVWQLNANKAGSQDLGLTYKTREMEWHTEYVATLNQDDTKMDILAWVSIENNSGASYENAKLKLIAGDVNVVQEHKMLRGTMDYVESNSLNSALQPSFEQEEFFEYHIYELQRPATLLNNETKQISLFDVSDVKIEKEYLVSTSINTNNDLPVNVNIIFENSEKVGLGMPFPKGKLRLFKNNGKTSEFIGEDRVDHTPRNEDIKVNVGEAFDVVAESKVVSLNKISDKVREAEFEVTLKNRKKEAIIITLNEFVGYDSEILETSHKYEKINAKQIQFKVPVGADKEEKVNLKIRYK